ncbi:MAG: tetratricopeptide repeat protein [Deltaproteobacteria bacterium]|nr:tetratricopeptide repeat protein [Deltaproteobacteria bacterium]
MSQLHLDRYGLAFTTPSLAAAGAYLDGVDRLLAADDGAGQAMQTAIDFDPGFALAQIGLARAHQIGGNGAAAKAAVAAAVPLCEALPSRERGHVQTLAAVVLGQPEALALVKRHIGDYPKDALVLAPGVAVFGLIGFSGRQDRNQETLAWMQSLASHYANDWWFGAWFGFLHTETGRFAEGRAIVERAFANNPRNANAAHALAHVCYEAGGAQAGRDFLAAWLPRYSTGAPLHCHLSWHQALFEFELGQSERAWQLFGRAVRPSVAVQAPPINALTDAASLLWRATLLGQQAPLDVWQETSGFAHTHFPQGGADFVDAHAAMAAVGARDGEALQKITSRLQTTKARSGDLLLQLTQALCAYGRAEWQHVIELLEPYADELIRVGGSGAQRDVFEHTLLSAYIRDGRANDARAWLRSRPTRPRNTDDHVIKRLGG